MRVQAGDLDGAEAVYRQATDAGSKGIVIESYNALVHLAKLRERAGDGAGAELLRRYGLNPDGTPAEPWSIP
ncbi:hypothetical protein [Catenulispora subtropica]|uniref:Uncharacterized protein n=1 Tax=Catenulispora subtropica TaxID=450798 RepID=A0ABN2R4S3_9ACTN